jgi:hypothetical protein
MRALGIFVVATLIVAAVVSLRSQAQSRKALSATGYYIAAYVNDCEPDPNYVEFRGTSNLPPGALITATVAEFDLDAWKDYGDEIVVSIDERGFFTGKIQPKKGMRLRRNLVLRIDFMSYRPVQPASVLAVVGRRGERLAGQNVAVEDAGTRSKNPQLFQVSGPYYGLETIARVPNCGEVAK